MRCSVEGCDRPHEAKGFCSLHYKRHRAGKPLNAPPRAFVPRTSDTCTVEDCDRPLRARGLCHAHLKRLLKGQPLDTPIKDYRSRQSSSCDVEGCDRPHFAKGFCKMHYNRMRRGRPLDAPNRRDLPGRSRECSVDGCTAVVFSRGLCSVHHHRSARGGELEDGELLSESGHQRGGVPRAVTDARFQRALRYAQNLLADAFTDYTPERAWRRACAAEGFTKLPPTPAELSAVNTPARRTMLDTVAESRRA